ncbi:MAG: flagellar biosynthesis protein FlhB [Deltaproteobacteria bacterium]|nr:flagellar biosynthesis protein FlhB [Deltaproteobacteria bacterium]
MAKENENGQEKTEQPTGKRIGKARDEGQVARSQEMNAVAMLIAAALYFAINGPAMIESLGLMLQELFDDAVGIEVTPESAMTLIIDRANDAFAIILPFFVVLIVTAVFVNITQIGFLFTMKPLTPKLSRFNTLKGLKQKFAPNKLVNLLKDFLKLVIVGVIPYMVLRGEFEQSLLLMDMGLGAIMTYIGTIILRIIFYVAIVMLVLAIGDLIFQRWKHNKDMMMTKQEVKDEMKQAEGDPKIKSRIRSMQMEFLRKMMMQEVPKADVVITNPVHLAVALKYDRLAMDAPTVVAKGARLMAEKIKEIARNNNVPVVENKPLAQSLYKQVEVGDSIPEKLYRAVAEVLAYVYQQKNGSRAG